MKMILIVGLGSFIGGILRYILSVLIQNRIQLVFPLGTFLVNVIGCFVIGVLFGLSERTAISVEWRLFFATGICGGFTTFSAFSLETMTLMRTDQLLYAGLYVVASVLVGVASTFLGYALFK